MKKKNFITLLIGAVAGLLFSIGMCMCLISEWGTMKLGIALAAVGGVALLVLGVVRWIMAGAKVTIDWRLLGRVAFGVFGTLVLGTGMCMIMVWNMMAAGIVVGVVGMMLIICLVPVCLGFKNN